MKQRDVIKFNKRFANGEQYLELSEDGRIGEINKIYYWQEQNVYNRILPAVQVTKKKYPDIKDYQIYGKNGLVDQLVPLQRAYNFIRNNKLQCLKRLAYGILLAEDGSVDIDALDEDGLSPGKILIYRQGSKPPSFMEQQNVYDVLDKEENKILQEMGYIIECFTIKNRP